MRTLNLVDKETSDIKFEVSSFPDGQQDIVIDLNGGKLSAFSEIGIPWSIPVQIRSRLNNWLDLELIICAANALSKLGVTNIHLYTPYLLGARSDRQFQEGGNSYLVDIIAPQLNRTIKDANGVIRNLFSSITVLDVHSNIAPACINNLKMIDNSQLVKYAIMNSSHFPGGDKKDPDFILVSPDAGASHKIVKLAEKISYTGDIITCSKERDKDGKLTKTVVPYNNELGTTDKDLIIIDDICDGGKTFINIAKEIKKSGMFYGKIYLIVTHGVFSAGFNELLKYFDGIYCTNSYSDLELGNDKNLIASSKGPLHNVIKQMNVF